MAFELHFETDNAVFEDKDLAEITRILRLVTQAVADGQQTGAIADINGNRIGSFEYEEDF